MSATAIPVEANVLNKTSLQDPPYGLIFVGAAVSSE